jgi:hypothetical protein
MPANWRDEVQSELQAARKATRDQMTGRSRVAARRAAGIALMEYNRWNAFTQTTTNFYDLLMAFSTQAGLPEKIQQAARRLCQRVDGQYNLPDDYDLIEDAEMLVKFVVDNTEDFMN